MWLSFFPLLIYLSYLNSPVTYFKFYTNTLQKIISNLNVTFSCIFLITLINTHLTNKYFYSKSIKTTHFNEYFKLTA